jgi:pimeloyl-ACP methyl ester carboxylesterase
VLRSFADGRVFGVTSGTGPPRYLALHGWGRTHADYDAVFAGGPGGSALDAVSLDLPGFGSTPPPPEVWGTGQYADVVGQVGAELPAPVVAVGHSFGGLVALQLAARHPEQVAALVLIAAPLRIGTGSRRRPAFGYSVVRTLARLGLVSDARLEAARMRHGSADYRAAQGVMREVLVHQLAEHFETALGAVSCGVTLLWADDDAEVPVEVARAAQPLVGRAELVVCEGGGHLLPTTRPDVVRKALLEAAT